MVRNRNRDTTVVFNLCTKKEKVTKTGTVTEEAVSNLRINLLHTLKLVHRLQKTCCGMVCVFFVVLLSLHGLNNATGSYLRKHRLMSVVKWSKSFKGRKKSHNVSLSSVSPLSGMTH